MAWEGHKMNSADATIGLWKYCSKNEVLALPDVKLKNHTKILEMTVDSILQWNDHIE